MGAACLRKRYKYRLVYLFIVQGSKTGPTRSKLIMMLLMQVKFYQTVAKELDIRVPACYYGKMATGMQKAHGVLIVEDLGQLKDPVFASPWKPDAELVANKPRCDSVVANLGTMHAKFWGADDRFNSDLSEWKARGRGMQQGDTLSIETKQQWFFYTAGWSKYQTWPGMDELSPDIKSLGDSLMEDFPKLYHSNFGKDGPFTFIHGDCAQYNVMFYKDGEEDKCCIFDWQMCQMGKGAFDIAIFLVLSTPAEFLAEHEEAFLEQYLETLKRKGVAGYEMEALKADYAMAVATVFAVLVYVAGLLDGKEGFVGPVAIAGKRAHAALSRHIEEVQSQLKIEKVPGVGTAVSTSE